MPPTGSADTVAGEIVRAAMRLAYRNWNDGDHLGVGYGRETCNPAGRYLAQTCGDEVSRAVYAIWGVAHDEAYDKGLDDLLGAVLAYLDAHPETRQEANTRDFWDYRDPYEDADTYDDEEDEEDDADCDGYDEEEEEEEDY